MEAQTATLRSLPQNWQTVVLQLEHQLVEVFFLAPAAFVVFFRVDDVPDALLLVEPVDLLDLLLDFFVDALAAKSSSAVSSVTCSTD